MIRMEHNRWSSYQYINGWEYSSLRDDKKKLHNCLLPLEDFEDNEIKNNEGKNVLEGAIDNDFKSEISKVFQEVKSLKEKRILEPF